MWWRMRWSRGGTRIFRTEYGTTRSGGVSRGAGSYGVRQRTGASRRTGRRDGHSSSPLRTIPVDDTEVVGMGGDRPGGVGRRGCGPMIIPDWWHGPFTDGDADSLAPVKPPVKPVKRKK